MTVKRNYFTKHKTYVPPVPRRRKRVKKDWSYRTVVTVPERVFHILNRMAEDKWMRPSWLLEEILDWFFPKADKLAWNFLDDGKPVRHVISVAIKTPVRDRSSFKAETLKVKKRLYIEMAIRFYAKENRPDLNWRN